MSVSNGIITAPVDVDDVRKAFGVTTTDVGSLCTLDRINQWALHKPMSGGKLFYDTDSDFIYFAKTAKCGLTAKENTYIKEACVNYTGSQVAHDYNAVLGQHRRWTYAKPTGGMASPYRLADFKNYRNNAIAPDGNYTDYTFKRQTLVNIAGYTVSKSNTSGKDWYITTGQTTTYRLSGLSIKTGEASYQGVNQSALQDIPISYIQGDINTESWRFGIAVYIDSLATDAKWQFFVSDWTFAKLTDGTSANNSGYCLPDLVTNQQAVQQMIDSPSTEFKYLPVLVKNCNINFDGAGHSYIYLPSDAAVYSVPSGFFGGVITKIADTESNPLVNGNWQVSTRYTGNDAQYGEATYEKMPINAIVVSYNGTLTTATDIQVTVQYSYYASLPPTTANRITETSVISHTMQAGTNPSYVYYAAPGLSIIKSGTKWTKP